MEARAKPDALTQGMRLLAGILYFLALFPLSLVVTGDWTPAAGTRGIWFGAIAVGLVVGRLMLEPYFTKPADALANGSAIVLAAYALSPSEFDVGPELGELTRGVLLGYGAVVIALALSAIGLREVRPGTRAALVAFELASRLGRVAAMYTVFIFATSVAIFAGSLQSILALQWFWLVAVLVEPAERLISALARRPSRLMGSVESIEDPGIVVVRFARGIHAALGRQVSLGDPPRVGHIVEVTNLIGEARARVSIPQTTAVPIGSEATLVGITDPAVVGHVSEGTDLEHVALEAVAAADESGLREGRLVEIPLGSQAVLYQVVSAEVFDVASRDFRRSLLRLTGRKLGVWNANQSEFETIQWLPRPGASASLVAAVDPPFDPARIGHVPRTAYGVSVDPHIAATHNTAILGILGVGKTHLAWELAGRMLAAGIKVVALDITGQYSNHFRDVVDPTNEQRLTEEVNAETAPTLGERTVTDYEAGNVRDFRRAIAARLRDFTRTAGSLMVVDPNSFSVTRMEGFPRTGVGGAQTANLIRLTMVEVTRIITEQLLLVVRDIDREATQENRTSGRARVCLFLEEAHSLAPEYTSVTSDHEKQASNGISRAILQGRKYGFGCVVITQRTANVTKSLLNQCNTVFAMRVFDATGMEFLANYIGAEYTKMLAGLRDRHAVLFGRASSCRVPVVLTLNEAVDFRREFWEHRRPAPIAEDPAQPATPAVAAEASDAARGDSPVPK